MNISVTETGVQIVRQNSGGQELKRASYEPGSDLWPEMPLAADEFSGLDELVGKELVRVDVGGTEMQFSFK